MSGRRTCLLCRTADHQRNLVPVRWVGSAPVVGRGAGRGRWFHAACVGLHPRGLPRLTSGQPWELVRAPIDAWFEAQVLAALANARRRGGIALGRRSIAVDGVVVLASDRRAPRWCAPDATLVLPLSAHALGGAVGVGPRRAIGVQGVGEASARLVSLARAWQSIASSRPPVTAG